MRRRRSRGGGGAGNHNNNKPMILFIYTYLNNKYILECYTIVPYFIFTRIRSIQLFVSVPMSFVKIIILLLLYKYLIYDSSISKK